MGLEPIRAHCSRDFKSRVSTNSTTRATLFPLVLSIVPFERTTLPFDTKKRAGNGTRTRDLNLGKVALYQLSYSRLI